MADSIKVTISPEELHAGTAITLEATITEDIGKIIRVVASVPEYELAQIVPYVADNTYRLNTAVPWDAPAGNYQVQVYAQGDHWNKLASTTINVKVL